MPALPNLNRDAAAAAAHLDSLVAPRNPSLTASHAPAIDHLEHSLGARAGRSPFEKRVDIAPGYIPTYYNFSGPAPGTVVGIVLGSVAGFLLLVWLLFSLTQMSGGNAAIAGEEEIVVRRPRRGSHSGRSRRSTRTEVREYSRSPRRSGGGRSTVIVEERRPPRARSVLVEDRRVPGDDVVEVIEERDDYRSRRGGRGYR